MRAAAYLVLLMTGCPAQERNRASTEEEAVVRRDPDPVHDATAAEDASALAAPLPVSSLPLTLLATQVPADPNEARATIRDHNAGTITNFRRGDLVQKAVSLHEIEPGRVTLLHAGKLERLEIDQTPAHLQAKDVYYADLIDDTLNDTIEGGVQLREGPGWIIKTPAFAWGTPRTVHRLRTALRAYTRVAHGGPDVHIGDLSRAGGGPFPPHLSHRSGRDVDIGYVLLGADADVTRFVAAHRNNLDRARTLALVRAILETRSVAWIFMSYDVQGLLYEHALTHGIPRSKLEVWFQYPHGNRATRGIIRDWQGHDDHFHVRFAP